MNSVKYLDRALKELEIKNDLQLSKTLGWSNSRISQYRTGKYVMDNEACLEIALLLNTDPMELIRAADIDRAERAGKKSKWLEISRQTSIAFGVGAITLVTLFLTPDNAQAREKLLSSNEDFILCKMGRKLLAWLGATITCKIGNHYKYRACGGSI